MSRKEVIVSMASVIAAAQSIAHMHQSNAALSLPSDNDESYMQISREAVSSSHGQAIVRSSMKALAESIRIDDLTLADRYAEVAATGPYMADSVTAGGFVSCYNNCHSACHGSRGWR